MIHKYPIKSWLMIFFLKLIGREIVKTGKCNYCGSCCRNINLQVSGKWLKKESTFEQIKMERTQYQRFYITGKDRQGYLQFHCSFQNMDGSCRDYENRLDICENFPNKSLVLCGGSVPENCGYTLKAGMPFSKLLQKAQKRHDK